MMAGEDKPTRELVDLEVDEISVVDRPAILRRFLVVKREEAMSTEIKKEDVPAEGVENQDGMEGGGEGSGMEGAPEMAAALALAMPALEQWAASLEDEALKNAVMMVLEHLKMYKAEKKEDAPAAHTSDAVVKALGESLEQISNDLSVLKKSLQELTEKATHVTKLEKRVAELEATPGESRGSGPEAPPSVPVQKGGKKNPHTVFGKILGTRN